MTIPANPLAHRPKPYAMTLGFLLVWISRYALFAGFYSALTDVLVPKQGLHSSFYALLLGCILAVLQRNEIRSLKTPQIIATASGVSNKPFVACVLPYAVAICAVMGFRQAAHAGPVNWAHVATWAVVAAIGGWATKMSLRFLPTQVALDNDPLEPIVETAANRGQIRPPARGKRPSLWLVETDDHSLALRQSGDAKVWGLGAFGCLVAAIAVINQNVWLTPVLATVAWKSWSLGAPQWFSVDDARRMYVSREYRPLFKGDRGFGVWRWPFVQEHRTGTVAEDFRGVGVADVNWSYAIGLYPRDARHLPVWIGQTTDGNCAREAMEDAAAALGLPALGRVVS